MTDKKLTQLLEHLRRELSVIGSVDDRGRELLRALSADIDSLLERSEVGVPDASMLKRLRAAIDHFEITHPSLTSTLSNLMTFLNNAGI